ncbi:glutamine synthetase 1, putative, partial [Ixodes scapularis]
TNTRWSCEKTMKEAANQDPWFGIEQEYVLLDADKIPLGWPKDNN